MPQIKIEPEICAVGETAPPIVTALDEVIGHTGQVMPFFDVASQIPVLTNIEESVIAIGMADQTG